MFETVAPKWCITHAKFVDKLCVVVANLPSAPQIILIDEFPATERLRCGKSRLKSRRVLLDLFHVRVNRQPKAILGRLKGIDHFIRWEIETVNARPGTRVSQLAAPSFDGFLKDAFVPLCSGGVFCAPPTRDDPGCVEFG